MAMRECRGQQMSWRKDAFTAADLHKRHFPPIQEIIPGFIQIGLTILAGKPKAGKSWMALDNALGVAARRPVLGEVVPDCGDVLSLSLEDNPRRLQSRVRKLLGDQ